MDLKGLKETTSVFSTIRSTKIKPKNAVLTMAMKLDNRFFILRNTKNLPSGPYLTKLSYVQKLKFRADKVEFEVNNINKCAVSWTDQVSIGPLLFASTFVLVGDHYQLPPLVQVSIYTFFDIPLFFSCSFSIIVVLMKAEYRG